MKPFAIGMLAVTASARIRDFKRSTHMTPYLEYNARYGKSYTDMNELIERAARWNAVENHINEFNAEGRSWRLAHNQFSDWSEDELASRLNKRENPNQDAGSVSPRSASFATSDHLDTYSVSDLDTGAYAEDFDWSGTYPSFPVRDQPTCGSCYAHTATYAVDYAYRIQVEEITDDSGDYQQFAIQQLLDCSSETSSNNGCDGGFSEYGFDYWIDNYIIADDDYPYINSVTSDGCQYSEIEPFQWTDDGTGETMALKITERAFVNTVTPNRPTPTQLKEQLNTQPVAIALCANDDNFSYYSTGVYQPTVDDCSCYPNHTVLAVGYGGAWTDSDSGTSGDEYFIILNSWGDSWGESGYFRSTNGIAENPDCGMCGIFCDWMSYPTVAGEVFDESEWELQDAIVNDLNETGTDGCPQAEIILSGMTTDEQVDLLSDASLLFTDGYTLDLTLTWNTASLPDGEDQTAYCFGKYLTEDFAPNGAYCVIIEAADAGGSVYSTVGTNAPVVKFISEDNYSDSITFTDMTDSKYDTTYDPVLAAADTDAFIDGSELSVSFWMPHKAMEGDDGDRLMVGDVVTFYSTDAVTEFNDIAQLTNECNGAGVELLMGAVTLATSVIGATAILFAI